MYKIAYILIALLLAMPCIAAMNDTDEAYIQGLEEGYSLGYMSIHARTNATLEQEYNAKIDILNAWMDSIGYTGPKWDHLQKVSYKLPAVFGDDPNWYLK